MGDVILSEVEAIVGSKNISCEPDDLEAYSKDFSFIPKRRPDAVAWVSKNEEIQAIIKSANKTKTPLIPVSSGGPRFRGDTVPQMRGVVIDLSRMNQIIRINKRNRVVMVEPGVTFEQLQPELNKEGLRLITPLKPKKNKSVLGSVLEREPGIAPRYQWDVSDPLCCMEVIFGTGELLRTGEASGPLGVEAQWKIGGAQKFPHGPHQLDYHRLVQGAQGTMGVATWASIKCELLPTVSELNFIPFDDDDLNPLFGFTYEVIAKTLGEEIFIVNSAALASLVAKSADEIRSLKKTLPPFTGVHCINGMERRPEQRVEYQRKDMMDTAQSNGVVPVKRLNGLGSGRMLKTINSVSDEQYWKHTYKGGCEDIFFVSTLDRAAKYIKTMYSAAERHGYPVQDIGIYIQPIVQGTSCHVEFQLPYAPDDKAETEKVKSLAADAVALLIKNGAFFSRPYPAWAHDVYQHRADAVPSLKKIKSIFDPNNIMNPGKLCF